MRLLQPAKPSATTVVSIRNGSKLRSRPSVLLRLVAFISSMANAILPSRWTRLLPSVLPAAVLVPRQVTGGPARNTRSSARRARVIADAHVVATPVVNDNIDEGVDPNWNGISTSPIGMESTKTTGTASTWRELISPSRALIRTTCLNRAEVVYKYSLKFKKRPSTDSTNYSP